MFSYEYKWHVPLCGCSLIVLTMTTVCSGQPSAETDAERNIRQIRDELQQQGELISKLTLAVKNLRLGVAENRTSIQTLAVLSKDDTSLFRDVSGRIKKADEKMRELEEIADGLVKLITPDRLLVFENFDLKIENAAFQSEIGKREQFEARITDHIQENESDALRERSLFEFRVKDTQDGFAGRLDDFRGQINSMDEKVFNFFLVILGGLAGGGLGIVALWVRIGSRGEQVKKELLEAIEDRIAKGIERIRQEMLQGPFRP